MNEVASTIPIAEVVLTRMSPGGPLRQMSASKVSSTFLPVTPRQMPYGEANLTFAGRYVCDGCVRSLAGAFVAKITAKRAGMGIRRGRETATKLKHLSSSNATWEL